ncbi:DivIVA domain-containing protein [Micromonospora okii]|uniref:DivIVA domain-containing protein n=1 Tax=Micromonospora okii TaxID=1182970 RepID=UPI001E3E7632|nr:DivIVA domain-containing protein [Micromonospora okii]
MSQKVPASPGPRPSAYRSLLPWQVREQRFRPARFGRRGLDPADVRVFLNRLAAEMAAHDDALRSARLEAARLGFELRRLRAERVRRPNAGRR